MEKQHGNEKNFKTKKGPYIKTSMEKMVVGALTQPLSTNLTYLFQKFHFNLFEVISSNKPYLATQNSNKNKKVHPFVHVRDFLEQLGRLEWEFFQY